MPDWNHIQSGPKALTFVKDITTMLTGGQIRAVENEFMLLLLTITNDVILYAGKINTIPFTLIHRLAVKNNTIHLTFL